MLRKPRFWIGLCSTAIVLSVAVVEMRRTSPGPLAAVHARLDELTGFNSCAQCHGGWFGEMTESCLECHDDVAGQMDGRTGLHGVLAEEKAATCALCHSEHHGAEFGIVNRQSFMQAGVPDPAKFDHEMIGYAMAGKHLEAACDKCHKNADVDILPKGEKRYLGLVQDCATCHEDSHEGRMQQACAQCHGQIAWDQPHSSGHEDYLPLIGGHGDVSCRKCHAKEGAHSLENLGTGTAPAPRTCQQCHESPHHELFVQEIATSAGMEPAASCVVCHVADHVSFREEGLEVTAEQHAASGFRLGPPHGNVTCAKCHKPVEKEFSARYPGRDQDTCAACHDDPHEGQFGKPAKCIDCHDRQHFKPHVYTVEKHAETALPLTGSHVDADCASCHKGTPRVFRGTAATCDACHEDAHAGYFDRFAKKQRLDAHGACALCHVSTKFDEIPAGRFDHEAATTFPVEGAHAQEECESCHTPARKPDRFGRTFGRVAAHKASFRSCTPCHNDPHGGDFDKRGQPRRFKGQTGCARCHVETSFRTFPDGFDHGQWTGFDLVGAHAKADCSGCHAPLRKPQRNGRTWARAIGRQCSDCHNDPHAGQFTKNGRDNCQKCHRNAMSFSDLSFRHNLDSRFRLDRTHAAVACAGCHKTERAAGGKFVRYKPLGKQCADCHRSQKNPLKPRRSR